MKKRIFRSIFITVLAVLIAGIGVATGFLYGYFNGSQIEHLRGELALVSETVNKVGEEYFENFDSTMFRFTVVDKDGSVLYDTEADASKMENHSDREEIQEAFSTGKGSSARYSSTLTRKNFYEAVLLDNGDVLRISVTQLTIGALILRMLPGIIAVILTAAAVALLISHGVSRKLTEPLMKLDLDNPFDNDTYEELTPILTKIHNQHKQIRSQMDTLKRRSDEFKQIISSMNEGLVLLDEHGMVLSMNASARRIFEVNENTQDKDFLLMDRTKKMTKALWRALEGEHSAYNEQRNGCEYSFTVNPIKSGGRILGAVILAFDITDRAFAERNRREFTANVTHELKTPLQSIMGSAELLESGLVKPQDTGRFIGNIRKEASRLVTLINDIIRLSQLDEDHEPASERVDLYKVAGEVIQELGGVAESKGVTLTLTGQECVMTGINKYLYEIIYNLCDNAIRYNTPGGRVDIELKREKEKLILKVSDTGIGIPLEHQTRIFERFYRVDKSHSKQTGGTGLGLSIVKHAVAFHEGSISLDSTEGKGTTITVEFKDS